MTLLAAVEPMQPVVVALVLAAGVFAVIGAIMNWDWFFSFRPAPMFVALFGRNGARVFYVVIGIALCVFGVLAGMGKV